MRSPRAAVGTTLDDHHPMDRVEQSPFGTTALQHTVDTNNCAGWSKPPALIRM